MKNIPQNKIDISDIDIDAILNTASNGDELWDKVNFSFDTKQHHLYLVPDNTYKIRLLGPYLPLDRIFIPRKIFYGYDLEAIMKRKDIASISDLVSNLTKQSIEHKDSQIFVNGHSGLVSQLLSSINGKGKNGKIAAFLLRFFQPNSFNWSKCVLVNVMDLHTNALKILTISKPIATAIVHALSAVEGDLQKKLDINGLFAHNLCLAKKVRESRRNRNRERNLGIGLYSPNNIPHNSSNTSTGRTSSIWTQTFNAFYPPVPAEEEDSFTNYNYIVTIEGNASYLNDDHINMILKNSLFDLKAFVETENAKLGTYYYQIRSNNYKMPDEYMQGLKDEIDIKIQEDHLLAIEEEIDTLPKEAFDNPDINNSMANLKLKLD